MGSRVLPFPEHFLYVVGKGVQYLFAFLRKGREAKEDLQTPLASVAFF